MNGLENGVGDLNMKFIRPTFLILAACNEQSVSRLSQIGNSGQPGYIKENNRRHFQEKRTDMLESNIKRQCRSR